MAFTPKISVQTGGGLMFLTILLNYSAKKSYNIFKLD